MAWIYDIEGYCKWDTKIYHINTSFTVAKKEDVGIILIDRTSKIGTKHHRVRGERSSNGNSSSYFFSLFSSDLFNFYMRGTSE